jgi:hypothetical protein
MDVHKYAQQSQTFDAATILYVCNTACLSPAVSFGHVFNPYSTSVEEDFKNIFI